MDSSQLEFASQNDPFISNYKPEVILLSELDYFKPHKIYFILMGGREREGRDRNGKRQEVHGHWILVETVILSRLGYYDPLAFKCPKSLLKKVINYCEQFKSKFYMNKTIVQLPYSSICGPIVLFVAMLLSRPGNSYKNVNKVKMNHSLKFIAKVLPTFISYFLPKGHKKLDRFSLDFIM